MSLATASYCSCTEGPFFARHWNSPSTEGPHIHPGTTELTRMWCGPSSLASTWAAVINAPLDAA